MGSLRVRWKPVARGAAGALVLVLALWALPGLLEPAPPGPLAADIGLPRGHLSPPRAHRGGRRSPIVGVGPARALGRGPRRRRVRPAPRAHSPRAPAAAPAAAYPPPPAPTASSAPAAAPPAPGDGSMEFAPH